MSWIKKIIGKFSDVDDSYEEYVEDEVQRPVRKQAGSPAAPYQRDVEARMTYQYPKGNFRFPLIGDGEGGAGKDGPGTVIRRSHGKAARTP
ncbi:hypothetical protein ACPJHQ_18680 [Rossellomorea sp. H39__3]